VEVLVALWTITQAGRLFFAKFFDKSMMQTIKSLTKILVI